MMFLLKKFFSHVSHYQAVLPYNLNWRLKNAGPFSSFLMNNPIVVADIGARGGAVDELSGLMSGATYYAFDADAAEAERLRHDMVGRSRVFPVYIGETNGPVEFHIYKRNGESSSLRPSPRYRQVFQDDQFEIERSLAVESRTLDDLILAEKLNFPDMIKLDVQGGELAILSASPKSVSNALLIEAEVEFTEQYEGQPLFHNVCEFLYRHGYELLYLNRVFVQRRAYRGVARGQITFGDALFGRREDRLEGFSTEAIAKYAILLINYGHIDFAHQLLELFPAARGLIPGVDRCFTTTHRITKGLVAQYDKIICLLLSLRGSNHLLTDSDRSWPIR